MVGQPLAREYDVRAVAVQRFHAGNLIVGGQCTQVRNEMTLGAINHIALTVADLVRSLAFYRPVPGFLGYRLAMAA
jgi:hypothetical protein